MARIFISYASEDRDVARMVVSALAANGYDVWWDRKLDHRGFHAPLAEQASAADVIVVILSRQSAAKGWVRKEVEAGIGRLAVMRIDDVPNHDWPPELRVLNIIDVEIDGHVLGPGFCDVVQRCKDIVALIIRAESSSGAPSTFNYFLGQTGTVINKHEGPLVIDQRRGASTSRS